MNFIKKLFKKKCKHEYEYVNKGYLHGNIKACFECKKCGKFIVGAENI